MKKLAQKSTFNIQKTKFKASDTIISWQEGKKAEAVIDFIFLGSKTTAGGDCSHEIKGFLLLGRKAMTNLDGILKSRHHFANKVHVVKTMVFTVVMHRWENWTIKKAEQLRVDAFELWCWRRRLSWQARRLNQSILKEINAEHLLEGPMFKLMLQYFGQLTTVEHWERP